MRAMDIRELLLTTRRIALVGASPKPDRASFRVMRFSDDNIRLIGFARRRSGHCSG